VDGLKSDSELGRRASRHYSCVMGVREKWRESRLRRRFMPERAVVAEALAQGHTPDATVDEVGAAGDNIGFDGRPIRSKTGNGYGTGDPAGPGWAGWGA
jgi:hypothetical protein